MKGVVCYGMRVQVIGRLLALVFEPTQSHDRYATALPEKHTMQRTEKGLRSGGGVRVRFDQRVQHPFLRFTHRDLGLFLQHHIDNVDDAITDNAITETTLIDGSMSVPPRISRELLGEHRRKTSGHLALQLLQTTQQSINS